MLGEHKQWEDFSETDGLQSDCCQQPVSSPVIPSTAQQYAFFFFLLKCEEMQYKTVKTHPFIHVSKKVVSYIY